MSLSGVLTALLNYAGDVLVNDCGRPAPRVLRYHGIMPHDCCADPGFLVGSWEREYASSTFPNAGATNPAPCPGTPVTILILRYVVCWPVPKVSQSGVTLMDDGWDERAAVLADVADCMSRAFMRLQCGPPAADDEYAVALMAATGRERLRLIEATPIAALGGCAGVQWRLYAGVAQGPPAAQTLALPAGEIAGGGGA